MKTWLEIFEDISRNELVDKINTYCQRFNYEIVSISVMSSGIRVNAFVVLKEGEE